MLLEEGDGSSPRILGRRVVVSAPVVEAGVLCAVVDHDVTRDAVARELRFEPEPRLCGEVLLPSRSRPRGRNARALLVDVGSRVEQGAGLQAVVGAGPGDGEPNAEVEADGPNPVAVEKDCSARSPKPKRPGVPRSMPAIKRAIYGRLRPAKRSTARVG